MYGVADLTGLTAWTSAFTVSSKNGLLRTGRTGRSKAWDRTSTVVADVLWDIGFYVRNMNLCLYGKYP